MGIVSWIVLGLVAGILAKFILPGKDPGGLIVTTGIGMVGGVIGGYLGSMFGFGSVEGLDLRSVVTAVVGAIVLLLAIRLIKR